MIHLSAISAAAGRGRHRYSTLALCLGLVALTVGCGALDEFERQVAADIQDNPVIVRHVGNIETIDVDWTATGEEPGDDVFVFHLSGSKGDGILTAECITVDADHEDVVSGSLRLASGETIDLFGR